MSVRLANSPDSWGVWFPEDESQIPWRRYLDEVAAAGYGGTELGPFGYLPTDAQTLRSELAARDLQLIAGFAMPTLENTGARQEILASCRQTGQLLAETGAQFLVLIDDAYLDLVSGLEVTSPNLDAADWGHLVDMVNEVGREIGSSLGLRVVFHPHADTHVQSPDDIDRLLDATDPEWVSLCLDVGHVEYVGGDAVECYRRHADRIAYLHLKSVDPKVRDRARREALPLVSAVEQGVFCEPGIGTLDYAALHRELEAAEFSGWATVEQDMAPARAEDALGIASRTREFFESIGMATPLT